MTVTLGQYKNWDEIRSGRVWCKAALHSIHPEVIEVLGAYHSDETYEHGDGTDKPETWPGRIWDSNNEFKKLLYISSQPFGMV